MAMIQQQAILAHIFSLYVLVKLAAWTTPK
jgi:hypothetical protein